MLFADTVVPDPAVHTPKVIGIMLVAGLVIFSLMGLNDTIVGEFMRPAIGEPTESGVFGNLAIGLVMSMLFIGNIVVIGFLPFRAQVLVVWIELLVLFLSFFLLQFWPGL